MTNVYIKIPKEHIEEEIFHLTSVLKVLEDNHYPTDLTPEMLTIQAFIRKLKNKIIPL